MPWLVSYTGHSHARTQEGTHERKQQDLSTYSATWLSPPPCNPRTRKLRDLPVDSTCSINFINVLYFSIFINAILIGKTAVFLSFPIFKLCKNRYFLEVTIYSIFLSLFSIFLSYPQTNIQSFIELMPGVNFIKL